MDMGQPLVAPAPGLFLNVPFQCKLAFFGGGAVFPCAYPPPQPSILSDYYFLVHHPVNRDEWHILAHAMASDFTVTWQFSQREQLFFFFFFILDQTRRLLLSLLYNMGR
jgi:hypothetical protein